MSASDDAKEIISLVSKFEREINPDVKYSILEGIEDASERIVNQISSQEPSFYENVMDNVSSKTPQPKKVISKKPVKKSKGTLSTKKKKKLLKELHLDEDEIKKIYKKEKKSKKPLDYDFTVYVPSNYGKVSNKFFGNYVDNLLNKKSPIAKNLSDSVRLSGMNILSKTYISMMLFSAFWGSFVIAALSLIVALNAGLQLPIVILLSLFSLISGAAVIFGVMYAYPASEASKKSKAINNDLPFATIHMAAVAGSGAQPLAIFKLLLKTGEYKGLESEIKKIVNLVNLFGYDLSTALKNVALRTPSKRFKELLTGIAATIESGGSLKSYLSSIADDSMNTYRLERKKYVESLSTYSDIYTGVLIAAPLLLMVTLAIINMMGGKIGGLSVATISWFGTLVALPVINVLFYLFLNITQPED